VTQPDDGRRYDEEVDEGRPVVRDKRRIDPVTGKVRHPVEGADASAGSHAPGAGTPASGAGPAGAPAEPTADGLASEEIARLQKLVDERTTDLQRLQAEYVNYRRRVDRDRAVAGQLATAKAVTELLPVLDDIDRAEQHGELTGGFKSVADSLVRALERMGAERYGQPGDPFDPTIHEALIHQHSDDVDGPTCTTVLQPGYRMGERILRAARVAVSEPNGTPAPAAEPVSDNDAGTAAAAGADAGTDEPAGPDAGGSDSGPAQGF
jgi:molecular chaperone GrpE